MQQLYSKDLGMLKMGFIGFGQMGQAMSEAFANKVLEAREQIYTYDPSAKMQSISKSKGFKQMENYSELVNMDIVMLCVKPHLAIQTCHDIVTFVKGKLLISVMAGISVACLMEATSNQCRVCRVITNLAASVGEAASAYTGSSNCTSDDFKIIDVILNSFGLSVGSVPNSCLDVTMAIAGSGPALMSIVIDALADAGVSHGLSRDVSLKLATQMMKGSASLLLDSGMHPGQLKDAVCSPGGISIQAVEEVETGGLRSTLMKAIHKACNKSKELSDH